MRRERQTKEQLLTSFIQVISELLWKPLRSDFPGTKRCARNTSTEKSSERGSLPAETSSRQKRYVIGTTNRGGHDRLTR